MTCPFSLRRGLETESNSETYREEGRSAGVEQGSSLRLHLRPRRRQGAEEDGSRRPVPMSSGAREEDLEGGARVRARRTSAARRGELTTTRFTAACSTSSTRPASPAAQTLPSSLPLAPPPPLGLAVRHCTPLAASGRQFAGHRCGMGSPHLEEAHRLLLPRRNLADGEKSAGQTGGRLLFGWACVCSFVRSARQWLFWWWRRLPFNYKQHDLKRRLVFLVFYEIFYIIG